MTHIHHSVTHNRHSVTHIRHSATHIRHSVKHICHTHHTTQSLSNLWAQTSDPMSQYLPSYSPPSSLQIPEEKEWVKSALVIGQPHPSGSHIVLITFPNQTPCWTSTSTKLEFFLHFTTDQSLPLNIMLSLGQGYFVIFHIGTERGRYFVIFQTYFRTVCSSDPQGTSIGDSLVAFPGLLSYNCMENNKK